MSTNIVCTLSLTMPRVVGNNLERQFSSHSHIWLNFKKSTCFTQTPPTTTMLFELTYVFINIGFKYVTMT